MREGGLNKEGKEEYGSWETENCIVKRVALRCPANLLTINTNATFLFTYTSMALVRARFGPSFASRSLASSIGTASYSSLLGLDPSLGMKRTSSTAGIVTATMYIHEIWRRRLPAGYWVEMENRQPDTAGPIALPPA